MILDSIFEIKICIILLTINMLKVASNCNSIIVLYEIMLNKMQVKFINKDITFLKDFSYFVSLYLYYILLNFNIYFITKKLLENKLYLLNLR